VVLLVDKIADLGEDRNQSTRESTKVCVRASCIIRKRYVFYGFAEVATMESINNFDWTPILSSAYSFLTSNVQPESRLGDSAFSSGTTPAVFRDPGIGMK
jgi:hypothetical protein